MSTERSDRLAVFAQLLGQLRDPLLIASTDGRVHAANIASADALGTSVKALDGASLATYTPDPSALAAKLRRPSLELQVPVRARDGRRLACDASTLGPDLLLVRLTGESETDPRVRRLVDGLSRLSTLAPVEGDVLEQVASAILSEGVSLIGAHVGGIFLLDDARANLELKADVACPAEFADRYRLVPLSASLPITDAVRGKVAVLLDGERDVRARYPQFAAASPEIAQNAFAALPLEVDDECVGSLVIGFATPVTLGPQEQAILTILSHQCANAIARVRQARDRTATTLTSLAAQRLERLHSFTRALAQALTPAQVAEAVVDMGMAATSATAVELWVLAADPSTVRLSLSRGATHLPPEALQTVSLNRPSRTPILDAIRDGSPIWIESRRQLTDRYPDIELTEERSMTCLPLFAQGRCIGGLSLSFNGVHRFVEDERAFLQVISWHSAQAVERAYLYSAARRARDEAEESRRRSDFLADVGTLLASSLDAKDILKSVASAAVPAMADWCIVKVSSDRLQRMTFVSHVERSKTASLVEMVNRLTSLGFVPFTQEESSVQCRAFSMEMARSQFESDAELTALMTEVGIGSALFVPISARGAVLGSIVLNRGSSERGYDERDLAVAEELGRRVGLAVDNARLYQESREADRLKDEFLAMLSHELRNPLAPILTAIELMNLRGNDAFGRERAVISRHVHQAVRLVDDLFDVSRITRGKVQLSKQPCDLSTVVATAIEMVTPLCEKRKHLLRLEATPERLVIHGDQARLTQALGNVLTNAAKYTPAGGQITVTVASDDSDAIIGVRDTGNGIAPELLPRVFDLFVQGETPLDRTPGGLGIGLTIVQRIVAMHDGSVSAQSDGIGHGSEFLIRLPRMLGDVTTPKPSTQRPPRPTTSERRVLIVDDNQDAAILLGEALTHLGWSVQTAHDGHAALELATAFAPQLVLLDIGLPVMDGYELARNLRRLTLAPDLRLIAVTGYGQASDRARSAEAGIDDHVVKPVDLNTLRRVLDRTIGPPSGR